MQLKLFVESNGYRHLLLFDYKYINEHIKFI